MATPSVSGSQRFKIAIKSAEEVQSQPRAGDLGALRAAAQVRRWRGGAGGALVGRWEFGICTGCLCRCFAHKGAWWVVQLLVTSRMPPPVRPCLQGLRLGGPGSVGGSTDSTPFGTSRSAASMSIARSSSLVRLHHRPMEICC